MDGVLQQDSVARRVDEEVPACGVDEEVPEDLVGPEPTREGHGVEASGRLDEARRSQRSPRHLSYLRFLATTRYP